MNQVKRKWESASPAPRAGPSSGKVKTERADDNKKPKFGESRVKSRVGWRSDTDGGPDARMTAAVIGAGPIRDNDPRTAALELQQQLKVLSV